MVTASKHGRVSDASGTSPMGQHHDPARYRVLVSTGLGGLGKVTRVHDLNLGHDIASKELIPQY